MKRALVALAALSLAGATACGNLFSPAAAVVNGHKITTGEVETALDQFLPSEQHDQVIEQGVDELAVQRQFEQFYLTRIVRLRVLQKKAEELGVFPSDKEIEAGVSQVRQSYGNTFDKVLARVGLSIDTIRAFVTLDLTERALKAKVTEPAVPTEDELRAFYDSHIDDYTQTRASHIRVDDRELAEKIVQRLRAAPSNEVQPLFATLAKKYSTDEATADRGGDLGFLTLGQVPEAFAEAALALEPGEVSDVVQTSFGFDVILVTERDVQPFEEAKDAIEQLIGSPEEERLWREFVIDAYEDADVKVNPRYGELDLDSQEIVNASTANVPGTDGGANPTASPLPELTPAPTPS